LIYQGLIKRFGIEYDGQKIISSGLPEKETQEIINRLEYELSVIGKTGFVSYILIVQDFVNWAKGQNIVVGPGRGSAPAA